MNNDSDAAFSSMFLHKILNSSLDTYNLSLSCCQELVKEKELIENEGENQDNVEKEVDEKGERIEEKKNEAQKGSKRATGSLEYLVDVTVAYPKGKFSRYCSLP